MARTTRSRYKLGRIASQSAMALAALAMVAAPTMAAAQDRGPRGGERAEGRGGRVLDGGAGRMEGRRWSQQPEQRTEGVPAATQQQNRSGPPMREYGWQQRQGGAERQGAPANRDQGRGPEANGRWAGQESRGTVERDGQRRTMNEAMREAARNRAEQRFPDRALDRGNGGEQRRPWQADRRPDAPRTAQGYNRGNPRWDNRPGWQNDQRGWDNRNPWRGNDGWRNDNRGNRAWDRGWRSNTRYDWSSYRARNRAVFRGGTYYSPYQNYSYRRVSIGFSLGSPFYGSRYWINDPFYYRLPDVYGPYRWIRYYDDVLLVDIYSGEVVDAIYDFFW